MAWPTRSKTIRVFSWWGVLIICVLGALLVGGVVALFWPSTFTASSSFFVSDPADLLGTMLKDPSGAPTTGLPDAGKLKPSSERLAAVLSSRLLRSKLVKKHELAKRLDRDPNEAEEILARMAKITPFGEEGFSIAVTCRGYSRLRTMFGYTLGREEARLLSAALANDYLAELQSYITTTAVSEARKKREFIETAQRQVMSELHQAESGIERLQTRHALLDPASEGAIVSDRIKVLQQAQAEAHSKVTESKSSLAKAQGQLGRVDSMRVSSVVEMRNPVIADLEGKLAQLRVNLATEESQGKTRENADVVQILSAIQSTQHQLDQVRQDVHKEVAQGANPTYEKLVSQVVDLQVALAGAKARSGTIDTMLRQARANLTSLPPVARQFSSYKQDQDIQFAALAALKQSLAMALVQEQESKRVGEFLVLDQAVAPPDLNGPPILLSMAITFGALLCFMGLSALNKMIFGG